MGLTERELCPNVKLDGKDTLPSANRDPWYAIVSKPQHERTVYEGLVTKGIEGFLPLYWMSRRWSDRTVRSQLPLFPGYVFCRFDTTRRLPILQTPGVRSIVSFGSKMVPIPHAELERIQRMLESGSPVEPWPYLATGQLVRVDQGPLTGLEGRLAEVRNTWRVVVNLDLLQRSVAVQLDRGQIQPLE